MRRLVGRVDAAELRLRGRIRLEFPPFHVLVVHADPRPLAIEDACNHAGASLEPGRVRDGRIRCPAHGFEFDLATGELVVPRGLCGPQRTFEVERDDDGWAVWDAFDAPAVLASGSTDGAG